MGHPGRWVGSTTGSDGDESSKSTFSQAIPETSLRPDRKDNHMQIRPVKGTEMKCKCVKQTGNQATRGKSASYGSPEPNKRSWVANLPTRFRETGDEHTEDCATGTRHTGPIHWARHVLLAAWSTSKLYGETLALKITSICNRSGLKKEP